MMRSFYIVYTLSLLLVLILTACAITPVEAELPEPIEPAAELLLKHTEPSLPELFPGKIAILTNEITCDEDEYRSAQQMVIKYGADKVIHRTWPVGFEGEQMKRILLQIAKDPDIKALIIGQCVPNSLAAVDALLEIRNDMFLVAIEPTENPAEITQIFDLIMNADEITMGEAMPFQAQKMGAKTLVHLSFPRHLSLDLISARHEVLKENCELLCIEFVSHIITDPTSDIGMHGAQQVMLEEIPKLLAQYGQDTAFFCTSCDLQAPLIKAVVDAGAIYPQPCCPSPFHGFPLALGLAYDEYNGEQSVIEVFGMGDLFKETIEKTIEKLAEKNMLGRISNWPVPVSFLSTIASAEYAIKWINGEAPKEGIDVVLLEQCMAEYVGVQCFARTLGSHEADIDVAEGEYTNWFLVREDYITYE